MDDVLEFVLDGLEQALELERELGVRVVELDRSLLTSGAAPAAPRPEPTVSRPETAPRPPMPSPVRPAVPRPTEAPAAEVRAGCDFVFVHDRPLSEKGVEMMAKIIRAMGRTAETAPIVVAPPVPQAKIVVVLGALALKKYFPELKGGPGQWLKTGDGREVLVTYSPEYILRFATVTPAVDKIKHDMWNSLKAVVQRVRV